MKQIAIKFQDDVQLNFMLDDKHEFLLTTKEVALGYGINSEAIRQTKRRHLDELIENKHFISVTKCNGNPRAGIPHNETYWTKRGIIRLGFFIKSERAKKFRDWCEDLIINSSKQTQEPIKEKL